jgi:hypothetical protein
MTSDISFFNYFLFKLLQKKYKPIFFNESALRVNLRAEQLKNSYLFFKKEKFKNNRVKIMKTGFFFFWKAIQY